MISSFSSRSTAIGLAPTKKLLKSFLGKFGMDLMKVRACKGKEGGVEMGGGGRYWYRLTVSLVIFPKNSASGVPTIWRILESWSISGEMVKSYNSQRH